jgi:hypothetical protein
MMNESKKPSVLWSVIGVGLPAFTTVMSVVNAFTSSPRNRVLWIFLAVVFGVATLFLLQKVIRAFTLNGK